MRNLKVRSAVVINTELSKSYGKNEKDTLCSPLPSSNDVEAVCISIENKIFCACKAGVYDLSSTMPLFLEWSQQRNGAELVSFDHLSDEYVLCAVFSSGVILILDLGNGNVEEFESVSTKVCSASWAPDYHVLLLASSDTLYFITRQFDIFSEQPLNSSKVGREELMTLGWGSKATQFQGTGSRKLPKKDDCEQPTVVSKYDSHKVLLVWNGDASYVVVSYVEYETNFRHFCVFDHEGELISRLQYASNVEEALAFKPTGNLIAISRLKNNAREIIFYERNGQKRSHFEHGSRQEILIEWMGWNKTGDIFCTLTWDSENAAQEAQFWCVSNYDWMLKYSIVSSGKFLLACWHENNANQFCYVSPSGRAVLIDFDFVYDFCDGIVLSITGNKVRVTDLKCAPIPPPMCHYELKFSSSVCEIAQNSGTAAFLLGNHSLLVYKLHQGRYEKYGEYDTSNFPKDCICYNLCLGCSNQLSAIVVSSLYDLCTFKLKDINREKSFLYSSEKPFIWHCCFKDGFALQGNDGKWISVREDSSSNYMETDLFISSPLHRCRIASDSILGINKMSDLVVNGHSILKYVGSYTLDQNYLLCITFDSQSASSKLLFNNLEDVLTNQKANFKANRSVEKGTYLIGHDANGSRVWLQMPRGNLETIHLRELLISKLQKLFDSLCFKEAALMMKKYRIDMNLFYDHNPEFFMKHVRKFVLDICCAELLNLFVASLNNKDVTQCMYSEIYSNFRTKTFVKQNNKIQIVCNVLRECILSLDDTLIEKLYTTVISTYLKRKPPQISEALIALWEQSRKLSNKKNLEEWISYVSLLAPNENLFKAALSTYDLNMALAVAEICQMDPGDYLSLILDFQKHSPPAYQRYKIDLYLGSYVEAIRNLSEVDNCWEQAAEIITRQNLYSDALIAFRGKKAYLQVCELCANHLMQKRRFKEAALLFMRSNNMSQALQCYRNAQNWEEVIECGQAMGMDKKAIDSLLQTMVPVYENTGKFADVAGILSYINQDSNKVQILEYHCKADAWDRALKTAFGNQELTRILCERACARCKHILEDVQNWENLLERYSGRLETVRQQKKDTVKSTIEQLENHDVSMSEAFSEASTSVSITSNASFASTASSRRRKHVQKKKKLLKEGSQYEDAALLNAMKDIIALIDSYQDELANLLPTLLTTDAVEEAHCLQTRFQILINFARRIVSVAWPTYLTSHLIPGPLREIYRDEDGAIRIQENSMPTRITLGIFQ
ncbi:unnamed protein product [Thelazia callipaeda]|uniref:Elongator complex protein 1 n=1 Tax=Thelazia callipaeda TaxID=103827 RepID=A0A0N5D9R4_THECL|nr:unnamed protein product [Thelazia callipaeda]